MSNNTGGPAFPQCSYNMKGGYDITGGMTLRDYFAAQAMQALLTQGHIARPNVPGIAYAVADAMLKQREASNGS